jgi:hypothetical protein
VNAAVRASVEHKTADVMFLQMRIVHIGRHQPGDRPLW